VNTYLGTLGGPYSSAININDAGTIIGVSNNSVPEGHGFLYSGGVMTDLGRIFPNAQNASGQVAGESVIGEQRAVLYSAGFTEDLGTFGGLEAAAYDINESGAAVGYADVSASVTHAFRRDPVCGDRIKDPTEDCDDGNSIDGDCCANDCSYPGPAMTCLAGVKTSLGIKNQLADSKDAIKWKWAGAAFGQADLGDPTNATVYTLCISDSTGGVDRLVATLRINPTPIWENHDPDGFRYAYDNDLVSGVYKVQLKTGDAAKAKIQISARGGAVPMPLPISESELFDQDTRVTAQLFNDTTATCWSSEFSIATKNKASGFKAKTP
jgi:probable HAF family extracellular repeat protein/cysteine-rich repeat protein